MDEYWSGKLIFIFQKAFNKWRGCIFTFRRTENMMVSLLSGAWYTRESLKLAMSVFQIPIAQVTDGMRIIFTNVLAMSYLPSAQLYVKRSAREMINYY